MGWDPHALCSNPGCGLCNPPPKVPLAEAFYELGIQAGLKQAKAEQDRERKVLEDHWRKGNLV